MKELFPRSNRYGQIEAITMGANSSSLGKTFVVCASTNPIYDKMSQLVNYDRDGVGRLFSTIGEAVAACTSLAGDTVLVAPGHTETLTQTDGSELTLNKDGVTILGLGQGNAQPKITFTTDAEVVIPVQANGITVDGINFEAGFADIGKIFLLLSADDFTLRNSLITAQESDENFLAVCKINSDNSGDGLSIENVTWIEPDTATEYMVDASGAVDRLTIKDCYVNLGGEQ